MKPGNRKALVRVLKHHILEGSVDSDQALRTRPTIAIGAPEVNAATAYLASRVPTRFAMEGSYRIQLDPEYIERRVCLWGTTTRTTTEALDQFIQRYLDDFLQEVSLGMD